MGNTEDRAIPKEATMASDSSDEIGMEGSSDEIGAEGSSDELGAEQGGTDVLGHGPS